MDSPYKSRSEQPVFVRVFRIPMMILRLSLSGITDMALVFLGYVFSVTNQFNVENSMFQPKCAKKRQEKHMK